MSNATNETLQIDTFLNDVVQKVKEGMEYRDAIELSAVIMGGEMARLVSQAINKYTEATFKETELYNQENVDECALASMGKLWHGENYDGSDEQMEAPQKDTILDALYFILKYSKHENSLEEASKANDKVCGDKLARQTIIEKAFNV